MGTHATARARILAWPRQPDIAQLVLVDHHMVPERTDIDRWLAQARATGAATVRTNALFPDAASKFDAAGFATADTLSLLELDLNGWAVVRGASRGSRNLRPSDLYEAAELDRQAFGDAWSNDAESLDAIRSATPRHRSRILRERTQMVAFAISGRAGTTGYIQRLAVDPAARRRGHARHLVNDALTWLSRKSVETVLVNTAHDNDAALDLYRSIGFSTVDASLRIMERPLT